MHSPLCAYLGVEPSGIAVATRNHHTSECEGALHNVLSEGLKLTHTLCCLPQVAKVTIASFLCAFILYMHKQCCIHTYVHTYIHRRQYVYVYTYVCMYIISASLQKLFDVVCCLCRGDVTMTDE